MTIVLVTLFFVVGVDIATPSPVHGGWGNWSLYGEPCSVTCGGGQIRYRRLCNNPVPQNNGNNCEGDDVKVEICNNQSCPEDRWTDWSECSASCGAGFLIRHRLCGDSICKDSLALNETLPCNTYNKTKCGNLCERKENLGICPKYAKCEDISNDTVARIHCQCVMGYKMEPDNKCHRPKPPPPTPRPIPTLSPVEKTVVVVITTTASTVLLILVGLTLIIFFLMRIFTPDRVIQMNMELALEIAHLFLLIPFDLAIEDPLLCRGISMALHYFFTACFTFMFLEALHMYSLVAFVVQRNGLFTRLQNTCVGWGFPILVLIFGICFHYQDYGGKYHCWLQMDTYLIYFQLVPILCLVILTFILMEAAGAADYQPLENVDEKQRFSAKMSQRSNLIIMPLIFTSWIMGTLSTYEQNLGMFSGFSVINTVIGVAIFMFHTLNNSEVRKKLKQILTCNRGQKKSKRR